jgi:hypothetical protein
MGASIFFTAAIIRAVLPVVHTLKSLVKKRFSVFLWLSTIPLR